MLPTPATSPGLSHPAALLREAREIRAAAPDWKGGVIRPGAPAMHDAALKADAAAINLTRARDSLRALLIRTRGRDARSLGREYRGDWMNYKRSARCAIRAAGADLRSARSALMAEAA